MIDSQLNWSTGLCLFGYLISIPQLGKLRNKAEGQEISMDKSVLKHALKSAEAIFLNPSVKIRMMTSSVESRSTVPEKSCRYKYHPAFGKKLNYGNFRENKIKAMDVCDTFPGAERANNQSSVHRCQIKK